MPIASNIPQCEHVRTNGTRCGSPALRKKSLCFYHNRMVNSQQVTSLPFYEDGDAIQLALWNVSRALLARYIDPKDAGRLLYALQIASTNLKHTRLKPYWKEVVRIDPADIALEIKRLAEKKAAGSEPPENLKQGDIAAV